MKTCLFWLLCAASIAATASTLDRGQEPQGILEVQLLASDGKPASHARVCVRELKIYHEADSALADTVSGPWPLGRGSYSGGGSTESTWMNTDAQGILHIERPLVAPHRDPDARGGRRRLIWTTSIWVPGLGATLPAVWILESGRPQHEKKTLLAAANVIGTVVDQRGRPCGGVSVEVSSETPRIFNFENWSLVKQTEADGTFRFDGLVPGIYGVTAWSPSGFQVVTETYPDELMIASSEETRLGILFVEDRPLRARLRDSAGSPLRDSTLSYQAWRRHGYIGGSFSTDGEGWFEFKLGHRFAPPMVHSGPPRLPGVVTLWVMNWRSDVPGSRAREDLVAGSAVFDLTREFPSEIEIAVNRTGSVVFDVRNADGNAIAYATVYFFRTGTAPPGGQPVSEELSAQRLDLPCSKGQDWPLVVGVPAGEYELYVRTPDAGAWATLSGRTRIAVEPSATVRLDRMSLRPLSN